VGPLQEVLRIIVQISNKGADLVGHLCHGQESSIAADCGQFCRRL
jgi:hypothetical protein